jgi:biopolymer transport protein TolQ
MPSLLLATTTTPPAAALGRSASVLDLFWGGGPMGKFVLFVLVVFSLLSWAVMLGKAVQFRRAEGQSERFLDLFRKSRRFSEVNASAVRLHGSPMVGIFQTGYAEIDTQIKAAGEGEGARYRIRSLPSLERSLQRAIHVELQVFSRWTALLATTAAATPFIGLFGTVWGIMVAFSDIGVTGSTSLVVVAPGIAEALINTAAGLAAAIPALLGYNYFAHRLRRLRMRMEDFALEFMNLAERNFT